MKHIFFSILAVLAFFRCQTAEAPKKRSLECYVRFLETEGQIRAEATLREGDADPQPVEAPGGIMYQGNNMDLRKVPAIAYKTDKTGGYELRHVFSWKDEKGKLREFGMEMPPLREFGFGAAAVSRNQPAVFRWQGEPLRKGEVLVFLWENAKLGKTVPWELFNTGVSPAIDFPAAKIAELDPGQWTLYLVRKKLTKADINGVAASGIIEYYSKTDTITVE